MCIILILYVIDGNVIYGTPKMIGAWRWCCIVVGGGAQMFACCPVVKLALPVNSSLLDDRQ